MVFLLLAIALSTTILLLFRYFKQWEVDNLQAIVANYLFAAVVGFLAYPGELSVSGILQRPWFPISLFLGFSFIAVFFLFAWSSQKAGVAVTAVASRMSVIIPVIGGFILFGEQATALKLSGIAIAMPAFYLTFKKGKGQKLLSWTILLPLTIFLGAGFNDLLMKYTDFHFLKNDLFLLLAMIFFIAMVFGLAMLLFRLAGDQLRLSTKSLMAGMLLGAVNFASTYFMFRSMEFFDSSVMYPLMNIGVVTTAALAEFLLFGEKPSWTNVIGISLAVVAIIFIAMG